LVLQVFDNPRALLTGAFHKAVEAADPYRALLRALPARPKGRVVVVGAGKAASQMARAFERAWQEPVEGVVVARHGPVETCQKLRVLTAAHPVPDEAGLLASAALLKAVEGLSEEDLVVALISGGGSALLPAPPEGFTLEDEQLLNRTLLASGAPIAAMNLVRAHFSRIKAGRLAQAAFPARVVSLVVSDIPGDQASLVASGPTIPDTMHAADALKVLADYSIDLPKRMVDYMAAAKTPDPSAEGFKNHSVAIIASAAVSLEAAARWARAQGVETHILSDSIEGEARDIALMHAALAREILQRNQPFRKPALLLSGGETTVTIGANGAGRGGRNSEFLLSFALAIDGLSGVYALAADTDGIDGSEQNAGAFSDGSSARRLRQSGADGRAYLHAHDAYSAFEKLGDLFVPGPTGTNVNDFRAILITR
jgi:hydroxypyruvate reductase